jgi:hypothetical protein
VIGVVVESDKPSTLENVVLKYEPQIVVPPADPVIELLPAPAPRIILLPPELEIVPPLLDAIRPLTPPEIRAEDEDEKMELFPTPDVMETLLDERMAELSAPEPKVHVLPATMDRSTLVLIVFGETPQISIHLISPSLLLLQTMNLKSESKSSEPPPSPFTLPH